MRSLDRARERGYILAAPMGYNPTGWFGSPVISMDGAGTCFLGSKHADIWAAVAPVAPAAFVMTGNRAEILQGLADEDVPVLVVHGDIDEAVPVSLSRDDWVPTMEEIGLEHKYVELPGITHGPVITEAQPYIFDFFDAHTK